MGYNSRRYRRDEIWHLRGIPEFHEHDEYGFRNPDGDTSRELFVTGDSWTYGATLSKEESWPLRLSEKGFGVFNASSGGWGPFEYLMAVKEFLNLKFKVCLVGLYLGNDLVEALNHLQITKSDLRSQVWSDDYASMKGRIRWNNRIRNRHVESILSAESGDAVAAFDRASDRDDIDVRTAYVDGKQFVFKPWLRKDCCDLSIDGIAAGMDVTTKCLAEIVGTCDELGIEPALAVFPSKESVFADVIKPGPVASDLLRVKRNEIEVENRLTEFLKPYYMETINLRDCLQKSATDAFQTSSLDGHPNAKGAQLIADALYERLAPKMDDMDANNYPLA